VPSVSKTASCQGVEWRRHHRSELCSRSEESVTFADGDTVKTIVIGIVDDGDTETGGVGSVQFYLLLWLSLLSLLQKARQGFVRVTDKVTSTRTTHQIAACERIGR